VILVLLVVIDDEEGKNYNLFMKKFTSEKSATLLIHFLLQYSINLLSKLSLIFIFKSRLLAKKSILTSSSEKHLNSESPKASSLLKINCFN